MSLRGQGVWILGAGFLGSALAAACRQAGAAVLTIDSAAPADLVADAAVAKQLASAPGRVVPKYAFCCLSTRGGAAEEYRRTYVGGLRALFSVAPAVRPVFCSSVSLYADAGGADIDETTPVAAANERQEYLLAAERLALLAGGAVARLAPLYGPGRCELLRRHLAGEPRLPGGADRWLNYLHVEDAVQAMLSLAINQCSGVYNVCSESFRLGSAYEMMQQKTGIPVAVDFSAASFRGCANRRVSSRHALISAPHAFSDFVEAEMLKSTLY